MADPQHLPASQPTRPPAKAAALKRWLPLLVLAGALIAVLASGLHRYLSFETLCDHRAVLLALVADHRLLAPLAFIGIYAIVVALSVPGGAILTIIGGFLFGTWLGGSLVVVGATIGATLLFLAAKTAIGDSLRNRVGPWLQRMEAGFQANALNYLLVLRLIPVFPFWLVNLVPAFLGVRLATYVVGTFFGIIPGSLVYASVGNGLGVVFDADETPDLGIIFRPPILVPIIGLALLALLPVIYRKVKAGNKGAA